MSKLFLNFYFCQVSIFNISTKGFQCFISVCVYMCDLNKAGESLFCKEMAENI